MDLARIAPWLLALVAVIVAVFVFRALKNRARLAAIRRAQAEAANEDEAFLDSSHISGPIRGLRERGSDAAAALRPRDPPHA
jgi:hypothetical protein